MKADLYVQGHFWAAIDVPGDSLLALLADGMITRATTKANQLKHNLELVDAVACVIHLRYKKPVTFTPDAGD